MLRPRHTVPGRWDMLCRSPCLKVILTHPLSVCCGVAGVETLLTNPMRISSVPQLLLMEALLYNTSYCLDIFK